MTVQAQVQPMTRPVRYVLISNVMLDAQKRIMHRSTIHTNIYTAKVPPGWIKVERLCVTRELLTLLQVGVHVEAIRNRNGGDP